MILMNAILIISLAPLVKKINRTLNQMFRHPKLFFKSIYTQTKSILQLLFQKLHTI